MKFFARTSVSLSAVLLLLAGSASAEQFFPGQGRPGGPSMAGQMAGGMPPGSYGGYPGYGNFGGMPGAGQGPGAAMFGRPQGMPGMGPGYGGYGQPGAQYQGRPPFNSQFPNQNQGSGFPNQGPQMGPPQYGNPGMNPGSNPGMNPGSNSGIDPRNPDNQPVSAEQIFNDLNYLNKYAIDLLVVLGEGAPEILDQIEDRSNNVQELFASEDKEGLVMDLSVWINETRIQLRAFQQVLGTSRRNQPAIQAQFEELRHAMLNASKALNEVATFAENGKVGALSRMKIPVLGKQRQSQGIVADLKYAAGMYPGFIYYMEKESELSSLIGQTGTRSIVRRLDPSRLERGPQDGNRPISAIRRPLDNRGNSGTGLPGSDTSPALPPPPARRIRPQEGYYDRGGFPTPQDGSLQSAIPGPRAVQPQPQNIPDGFDSGTPAVDPAVRRTPEPLRRDARPLPQDDVQEFDPAAPRSARRSTPSADMSSRLRRVIRRN